LSGESAAREGLGTALAAHHDRLSNCVHCGFCLPACPTYVRLHDEADSPRGRLYLMGAVVEGRLDPASDAFQRHMDRCLGCRACETVCPSGVEYGFLLERAKEVAATAREPSVFARALLGAIARPALFRVWMGASRFLRWTGVPSILARLLPSIGPAATLRFSMAMLGASGPWRPPRDGRGRGRSIAVAKEARHTTGTTTTMAAGPTDTDATVEERGRVAFLDGCVQAHLFRRVNEATARVLAVNGWEVVHVPGQGCCGALHAHGGRLSVAGEMARRNVRAFRASGVDWVVSNAAGCGATMREYGHLVGADDGEASAEGSVRGEEGAASRWFSERVRDVSEILAGDGRSAWPGAPLPVRVAYDPPCHLLHGQRVRTPPLALLASIPELIVIPVPNGDECCGGAGIYGITHPDLGGRIGGDKVTAVLETGAEVLATGNPGCAMQIGAGLRMRGSRVQVAHPVEILDESYRRAGLYGA